VTLAEVVTVSALFPHVKKTAPVTTVLFEACPSLCQPVELVEHVGFVSAEKMQITRSVEPTDAGSVIAWLVVAVA
jgi:hypothetical protein